MSQNYSITEAARILGISTKTVSRRLKTGKLQTVEVDGKRRVLLPDTTGHSDRTPDTTNDRTQPDIETIEVLRAERDQARAERDREREEVEFLRQRNAELNSIVMRHALALPNEKPVLELPDTRQDTKTVSGQDTTGQTAKNVQSIVDTRRKRAAKRLPFWVRFLGFR